MKTLGITWKINLVLLLIVVYSLGVVGYLSIRAESGSREISQELEVKLNNLALVRNLESAFQEQLQSWHTVLLQGASAQVYNQNRQQFANAQSAVLKAANDLKSASVDALVIAEVEKFTRALQSQSDIYESALSVLGSDPDNGARLAAAQISDQEMRMAADLEKLAALHDEKLTDLVARQSERLASDPRNFVMVTISALALAFVLSSIAFSRGLVVPIKRLIETAQMLSVDENKISMPCTHRKDEIGELARALETFRRNRISGLALQRSAELSIEEREREKQAALMDELATERAASADREKQHEEELEERSASSEKQLRNRIQRLSKAVSAAAAGDLKYLAAHPEDGPRPDDDLGAMTTDLESLFGQFDSDFSSIAEDAAVLNQSAMHLGDLGRSINAGAQMNTQQIQQVLSGAMTVKDALTQVSSSIEQMDVGISSISDSASQASSVATQAVDLARRTDTTMRQLSQSSTDIGNVIKLITSVAEQTNLLALNATIEAARAGDAGKGFAVVANEVKELAKETNKATDEIERRISTIRSDTDNAVEAIGSINSIVSEIDDIQATISGAVQEQSKAAQAITELVSSTTVDNKTVRELVAEVAERQEGTQSSATEIQEASERLRNSAEGSIKLTKRYVA